MRSLLFRLHELIAAGHDDRCYGTALDTITSTGTAIGATLAATTIAAGDSFAFKNTDLSKDIWLLNVWVRNQAAGQVRLRSSKFHENTEAIRSRVRTGDITPLLPMGYPQKAWPQDAHIVELAGSAVAGQIESVVEQVFYTDLPGQATRFISMADLRRRMRHYLGQRIAITYPTTAGYGGGRAINADADFMKANTDYALLGMTTDTLCAAICLRGPDTGNLRVSVGGDPALWHLYKDWFYKLALYYPFDLIPVINSANKGGTTVDAVSDQAGGTGNVTIWLAELGA